MTPTTPPGHEPETRRCGAWGWSTWTPTESCTGPSGARSPTPHPRPGPQPGGQPRAPGTGAAAAPTLCRAVPAGVHANSVANQYETARPAGGQPKSTHDRAGSGIGVAAGWGGRPPTPPGWGVGAATGHSGGGPGTRCRTVSRGLLGRHRRRGTRRRQADRDPVTARWQSGGAAALRNRRLGRQPAVPDSQLPAIEQALLKGAKAHGFDSDGWTAARVAVVIQRTTGVQPGSRRCTGCSANGWAGASNQQHRTPPSRLPPRNPNRPRRPRPILSSRWPQPRWPTWRTCPLARPARPDPTVRPVPPNAGRLSPKPGGTNPGSPTPPWPSGSGSAAEPSNATPRLSRSGASSAGRRTAGAEANGPGRNTPPSAGGSSPGWPTSWAGPPPGRTSAATSWPAGSPSGPPPAATAAGDCHRRRWGSNAEPCASLSATPAVPSWPPACTPPASTRPRRRPFPPEQYERLLAVPDPETPAGVRDRAIVRLLGDVGLRPREVCALQLGDLLWSGDGRGPRPGRAAVSRAFPRSTTCQLPLASSRRPSLPLEERLGER
jgi:hypothetical protein